MPDEFVEGADRVVHHLADVAPLGAWLVAVTQDADWTPVAVADRSYGFVVNTPLAWQDTLCSRMVQGLGPHVSGAVDTSMSYASAPIGRHYPIRAYIGTPLTDAAGNVVGTLCGIDPEPHPPGLEQHLALVRVFGDLLSRLHRTQHLRDAADARAAVAEAAASVCPLTGVLNRRGWLERLPQLVSQGDRSGEDLALLSLDLDDLKRTNDTLGHAAGDQQLVSVAGALRSALRPADVLARLGGDEFAVAAVVSGEAGLRQLTRRVRGVLRTAGLPVSVGAGLRPPGTPVEPAWLAADAAMYAVKQARTAAPSPRLNGTAATASTPGGTSPAR